MAVGFTIATASWFVMASVPGILFTVLAMSLFAIGEGLQSPRYYEYVASLAPEQQVGTYMGFAFLPIAIGTFIAGLSSGYLVKHYVEGGNPAAPRMWLWVGSYGVVSTLLMILYDRFLAPRRTEA
jgi:MFS family permease